MTRDCSLEFREELGDGEKQHELIQRLEEEVTRLSKKNPGRSKESFWTQAADKILAEESESSARFKQQLIGMAESRVRMAEVYSGFLSEGEAPGSAFRKTIGAMGNAGVAVGETSLGRLSSDLEREGVLQSFMTLKKDQALKVKVLTELKRLNTKSRELKPTGDRRALAIAEVFQRHVDFLRGQLREQGLKVSTLEGRMLKQVWDTDRILQKAKTSKDFVEDIKPRLSRVGDRPVSDFTSQELEKVLTDFYVEATGGVAKELELSPRNMVLERQTYAVRQAQSRELHFDSVEDSLHILETYGAGDMAALMSETVRDLGKQVQLNRDFGVNRRANMEWLVQHAVSRGADINDLRYRKKGQIFGLTPENIMNTIDGFYDNNSSNPHLSEVADTVHNFARSAMLSAASISALGDFPTLSAANRRVGIENASAWASRLKSTFSNLDEVTKREMAGVSETMAVHALGNMHRMTTQKGLNHKIYNASVWAVDKTFQLNGLSLMTRKNKQTAYLGFSNLMAGLLEKKTPFSKLSGYQRRALFRGGLVEKDWQRLLNLEGAVYIDGDLRLVNSAILPPDLSSRVNAVLGSFVNEAVITPDVLTRTAMTLGTQRGTLSNALVSQMTFLLGYPIAFLSQGFGRQVEATGFFSFGMFRYVAALTMMGTAVAILKDVAKGRDRDYENPEIMLQVLQEGMIYGGGMTILGETLWKIAGADRATHHLFFGEYSKYAVPRNRPFTPEDLLVGGGVEYAWRAASGVTKGAYQLITGDAEAAATTLAKTGQRTLPFVNLPGVKPLVDEAFFNPLIEMSDPFAIDKEQARWNRRTGGSFFLTD